MSSFVILDGLINQSSGNMFYCDDRTCSLSLLKEVILRGFQIQNHNPDFEITPLQSQYTPLLGWGKEYGNGNGRGCGYGDGEGE